MNNKCSKYASLVLVPLTAINVFVGCTMETKRDVMDVPYDDALSMQDIVSSEVVQDTNEFSELIDIYGKSGLDYSEILLIEDRWCDLYSSGLYAKLKAFLLDDEVILNELENIICFGTQATCMSEEMWISSFGNLLNTISEYDNVVDYYYPLAAYVHKRNCDLKHEPLFFDDKRITCSNIEELLNRKVPVFDYKNYVVDMIKNSGQDKLIEQLDTILNSDIDFDVILNELENVFQLTDVSISFSEEYKEILFGNLLKISSNKSDIFTEYYDLACYVHFLWCDFEHSINESGKYECEYPLILEK
jgi:hypothetical protein